MRELLMLRESLRLQETGQGMLLHRRRHEKSPEEHPRDFEGD